MPGEAETVGLIFRRYLELASIGALVKDLDRKGIRTRRQVQSNGRVRGGVRLSLISSATGSISEMYRGKIHGGEHEPLLDRELFDGVQARLADGAVTRRVRLRGSPAILTGRPFDDRGNRATAVAKAAEACIQAGNVEKAMEIALDIEPSVYEVTTCLNAASLLNRYARS